MTEPRNTKREDRRALVDAGKRYHAAKLAWEYDYRDSAIANWSQQEQEYHEAKRDFLYAAEVYAVGRRRASAAYGHKWYHRAKRQEGK